MKIYICFFLVVLLNLLSVDAQHIVFSNDSIYTEHGFTFDKASPLWNYCCQRFHGIDFKINLPDGEWHLYKYSRKKNKNQLPYAEGTFVDSLRQGKFIYYDNWTLFTNRNNENNRNIILVQSFNQGQCHGWFRVYYSAGRKKLEGFCKNGKKDGLFVRYYETGNIDAIFLYENDTLREWSLYRENGSLHSKGKGELYNIEGDVYLLDSLGTPKVKLSFINNKLNTYVEYYENGIVRTIRFGMFDFQNFSINPSRFFVGFNTPNLINGYIDYFSIQGELIKREIYRESECIDVYFHD